METVFAIVLIFTDFDDCWDHAHANKYLDAEVVCEPALHEKPPLAPVTSLRPKARPTP